jgi:hypothetical protein
MTTEKEKFKEEEKFFKEALKGAAEDAAFYGIAKAAREHADRQAIEMYIGYDDHERYYAAHKAKYAIFSTACEAARKAAIPVYKAASKAAFEAARKATAAVLVKYEAEKAADEAAYEDYKKKNKIK